jgi:hypothetical protein
MYELNYSLVSQNTIDAESYFPINSKLLRVVASTKRNSEAT